MYLKYETFPLPLHGCREPWELWWHLTNQIGFMSEILTKTYRLTGWHLKDLDSNAVQNTSKKVWTWIMCGLLWLDSSQFYPYPSGFLHWHCGILAVVLSLVSEPTLKIWVNTTHGSINSSPPRATYMRQWIKSALVQIMACRLLGAKPLSKPMLGYWQ